MDADVFWLRHSLQRPGRRITKVRIARHCRLSAPTDVNITKLPSQAALPQILHMAKSLCICDCGCAIAIWRLTRGRLFRRCTGLLRSQTRPSVGDASKTRWRTLLQQGCGEDLLDHHYPRAEGMRTRPQFKHPGLLSGLLAMLCLLFGSFGGSWR